MISSIQTQNGELYAFLENALLGENHIYSRDKCHVIRSGLSEVHEDVCFECHSGKVNVQWTQRRIIRK